MTVKVLPMPPSPVMMADGDLPVATIELRASTNSKRSATEKDRPEATSSFSIWFRPARWALSSRLARTMLLVWVTTFPSAIAIYLPL
jgi:hypothetical protein